MENTRDFSGYTDESIVEMYWRRDEDAIAVTDGRYGRYLYKLAYNILKEEDDSRSALDDTYLGAWNSIPPSRPTELLLYLCKIARRAAIDIFRRSNAKKRVRSELLTSLDELSECLPDTDAPDPTDDLTLRDALDEYLTFQEDVIVRRTRYDLKKAQERAHLLQGLLIAQDNIDEVIRIIRTSIICGVRLMHGTFFSSRCMTWRKS